MKKDWIHCFRMFCKMDQYISWALNYESFIGGGMGWIVSLKAILVGVAIHAGFWSWGAFSTYQVFDLVSAIQPGTKHFIFPIAGSGLLHQQDNYGVCWFKFLPIFHRVWPCSMRLRCLGRNSKRNLHVYEYLLIKSFRPEECFIFTPFASFLWKPRGSEIKCSAFNTSH